MSLSSQENLFSESFIDGGRENEHSWRGEEEGGRIKHWWREEVGGGELRCVFFWPGGGRGGFAKSWGYYLGRYLQEQFRIHVQNLSPYIYIYA